MAASYLRQSRPFQTVPEEDFDGLDPPPEIVCVSAGGMLMRQGETTSDYYYLISGRLRVFMDGEKGRLLPVGHVNPGEGVGEMSLIDRQSKICDGDCTARFQVSPL